MAFSVRGATSRLFKSFKVCRRVGRKCLETHTVPSQGGRKNAFRSLQGRWGHMRKDLFIPLVASCTHPFGGVTRYCQDFSYPSLCGQLGLVEGPPNSTAGSSLLPWEESTFHSPLFSPWFSYSNRMRRFVSRTRFELQPYHSQVR